MADLDKKLKEDLNLDRGQELYDGFGFGGVASTSVDVKTLVDGIDREARLNAGSSKTINNESSKAIKEGKSVTFAGSNDDSLNEKPVTKTIDPINKVDKRVEVSTRKEVPKDSKIVIKADKGDMVYKESDLDYASQKKAVYVDDRVRHDDDDNKALDILVNEESNKDTPADYELGVTLYGNDPRSNRSYLLSPYQRDVYSIKNHYKAQAKTKKKSLPLGKIALGAVALGAAIWLIRDDDKGGIF